MREEERISRVRIFVLGDTGVGKTALCKVLCSPANAKKESVSSASWTVGCRLHVRKDKTSTDAPVLVEFCDVGGSARFENSRTAFMRRLPADGVILVHDLTWLPSRASLRRLWLPELVKCLGGEKESHETLDQFFDDELEVKELTDALRSLRRGSYKQLFGACKQLFMRLLDVGKRYFRDFLGNDSQERVDERLLVRKVPVPMLMVGMKRDLATREQRRAAKADLPPSVPYAEMHASTVSSNPIITNFIQSVIKIYEEKDASLRSCTVHRARDAVLDQGMSSNGMFHRPTYTPARYNNAESLL